MNIEYERCSGKDECTIKWQLHTDDVYCGAIVCRCSYGFPKIILLDPVTDHANFNKTLNYESISNILWLTCPFLNKQIHELENSGAIEKIQKYINSERPLREEMSDAHAHYYYLRKRVYNAFFGEIYPEEQIKVFNTGIGGIRDTDSVKCLHIHFCHYHLCNENLVGLITTEMLKGSIECEKGDCFHAE